MNHDLKFVHLAALVLTFAAASALLVSGCDKRTPAEASPTKKVAAAELPAGLFLKAAPTEPKDIKATKPTLKKGDAVTLVGRIGGSEDPMVAERAIFTLVDRGLKACNEGSAMDACKTPWDYCCESREEITANSATVQVMDGDGKPMKVDLTGVRGLKPSATVMVVGTVIAAEGENLVVSATGLFIVQ